MFINAPPRRVSHCFETFVPARSAFHIRSGLFDMSSSEVNTWSANGSVAMATPQSFHDAWDTFHGLGNEESLKTNVSETYGDFEFPPSYIQGRAAHHSRATGTLDKPNTPQFATKSVPPQLDVYEDIYMCMDYADSPMQINIQKQPDWPVNADITVINNPSASALAYQTPRYAANRVIEALPASSHHQFIGSLSGGCDGFDDDMNSPSTIYSCYSPIPTISPDTITGTLTALDVQDKRVDTWWAEMSGNAGGMKALDIEQSFCRDGLPRVFDAWVPCSSPEPLPTQEPLYCDPLHTISPKALLSFNTLENHKAQMSCDSTDDYRVPTRAIVAESSMGPAYSQPAAVTAANRPRRKLPMQPIGLTRTPGFPSNDRGVSKSEKKREAPSKAASSPHSSSKKAAKLRPARTRILEAKSDDSQKAAYNAAFTLAKSRSSAWTTANCHIEPMPAPCREVARRETKDEFLVRSKLAGMSYKDIRRKGGFSEAESTLRGRFRTLTKDKEERVRRPAWTDNDLRLLKRGVRKYIHGQESSQIKVPWKKVAEYIYSSGGSYQFGNATCRKRWDEIQDRVGS